MLRRGGKSAVNDRGDKKVAMEGCGRRNMRG